MAKELERQGFPTALISALPDFAVTLGAPRVVRGIRIEHVCGDPRESPEDDFAVRTRLVETALEALRTPVAQPTVFEAHLGVRRVLQ